MSYELNVCFKSSEGLSQAMERLRGSNLCCRSMQNSVLLKDPAIESSAAYDIAVERTGNVTMEVDLRFKSPKLHQVLEQAFTGCVVTVIDETEHETTLQEIFGF